MKPNVKHTTHRHTYRRRKCPICSPASECLWNALLFIGYLICVGVYLQEVFWVSSSVERGSVWYHQANNVQPSFVCLQHCFVLLIFCGSFFFCSAVLSRCSSIWMLLVAFSRIFQCAVCGLNWLHGLFGAILLDKIWYFLMEKRLCHVRIPNNPWRTWKRQKTRKLMKQDKRLNFTNSWGSHKANKYTLLASQCTSISVQEVCR